MKDEVGLLLGFGAFWAGQSMISMSRCFGEQTRLSKARASCCLHIRVKGSLVMLCLIQCNVGFHGFAIVVEGVYRRTVYLKVDK